MEKKGGNDWQKNMMKQLLNQVTAQSFLRNWSSTSVDADCDIYNK